MHSWILAYANTGLHMQIAARNPEISSDFGGPFSLSSCRPPTPFTRQGWAEYSPGCSNIAKGHRRLHSIFQHPQRRHCSPWRCHIATWAPAAPRLHTNTHARERQGEQRKLLIVCGGAESQRIQPCVCSSCVTGMSPTAKSLAGGQAQSGRHLSLLGDLATPTCPNG